MARERSGISGTVPSAGFSIGSGAFSAFGSTGETDCAGAVRFSVSLRRLATASSIADMQAPVSVSSTRPVLSNLSERSAERVCFEIWFT